MALSVNKMTVGYSQAGATQLLKDVNAKVIVTAAQKLDSNNKTLKEAVDKCWRGNGAGTFKNNIDKDTAAIKQAMNAAYKNLQNEITAIEKAMAETAKQLVKKK